MTRLSDEFFMSETTVTAFPLSWPRGYERTRRECRVQASFGAVSLVKPSYPGGQAHKQKKPLTVAEALTRLHESFLKFTKPGRTLRIVPEQAVVSTNLRTRLDGLPYSGQPEPEDVGVAVYFEFDGKPTVMCCDKWTRVADNLNSIAATLEAMRALERYGVAECERAFTGFAALPAPGEVQARTCWVILGIPCTRSRGAINAAWKARCKVVHPDVEGGSHDAQAEVNGARDQALLQATED